MRCPSCLSYMRGSTNPHMHDEFVSCGRLRSELEPLEGPPRSGIEKRNHSSSAGSQRRDLDGSDLPPPAVLGCSFD